MASDLYRKGMSNLVLQFTNIYRALTIVDSEIALGFLCSIIEAIPEGDCSLDRTSIIAVVLLYVTLDLFFKLNTLHRSLSNNYLCLRLWLVFQACSNKTNLDLMFNLNLRPLSSTLIGPAEGA